LSNFAEKPDLSDMPDRDRFLIHHYLQISRSALDQEIRLQPALAFFYQRMDTSKPVKGLHIFKRGADDRTDLP